MERYEGHLLNWYDTRTLEPLNPRYVSTVDSGNLIAGSVGSGAGMPGCAARADRSDTAGLRGLNDTLPFSKRSAATIPRRWWRCTRCGVCCGGSKEGHELIGRYRMALAPMQKLRESQRWHVSAADERSYWAARLAAELTCWTNTADRYLRWMETLAAPPDSSLSAIGQDAVQLRRRALRQMPSLFGSGG